MKIKKYFAADMRQALNLARQEQGPDAVILGNRKVLGGIELIAADEYDEALFKDEGVFAEIRQADTELNAAQELPSPRPAVNTAASSPGAGTDSGKFWSRDNSLSQMQQELNSLRKLLEQQMSSLAWGEVGRRHPLWAGLIRKLGDLGISPASVREIVEQIPENYNLERAWRTALALLSYRIPICADNILSPNTVIAFAGASGTGKTTTIAKLAARFVLEHNATDIILATLDSYRVGGREQLGSYARILGVPVRAIHSRDDMAELLDQFHGRKLILIDTAGLSPRDQRYRNQIELLHNEQSAIQTCLILSATSQAVTLRQVIATYKSLRPGLCVLTKLDEANTLGGVLSVVIEAGLKIAFQTSGQQVPEDLARADATDLIARAVSMMKRFSGSAEDPMTEQNFGNYAVYHPLGEHHGRN